MPSEPETPAPPTGVPSALADAEKSKIENRYRGLQGPTAAKSKIERLLGYRPLFLLALAVLALDQASKFWIAARLPFNTYPGSPEAITVAPNFFYLVHVGNTGAAWSNFSGHSSLLAVLALATLVAIVLWRHTLGLRQPAVQVAFGLLCGGIAGNLLDRLRHGHVTDFLDLHFGSYIYPTFNVADSGICVGTLIYIVSSLRQPK
jgi:signal peptidase II